ncbi:DUF4870 domain-containing protein [Micromonospora sp. NPDC085948]|uniref:DUF4870 domain-containing protein n=1 Tax=Micromonospora sp. NPDC085948 TaxID=3155293 RepID=UPI003428731E
MTEPPRPPGAGDPGNYPPEPTSPSSYPSAEPPTAPLSGAPGPGGYPPAGGYPPPTGDQPPSGGYPPAGGYPPPGGYPPAGGYPPPGGGYPTGGAYGGPGGGFASNEDKTWALVAHFGGAAGMILSGGVLGWIAPLVALLARGNQSPTVRSHAAAALNFQLIWSVVGLVGWVLSCILIGFIGVGAAIILGAVFGIIAGIKANEGQLYRYPLSASFIK